MPILQHDLDPTALQEFCSMLFPGRYTLQHAGCRDMGFQREMQQWWNKGASQHTSAFAQCYTPQQPCPRSEVNRYCNFTATNPCNPQKPIYTTSIDLCEVARTLWQSLSSQYTATNQISQAPREKNASAATNWVHRLVAVRQKSEHWAQFCLNSDQWVHPQKSIYGT